MITYLLTPALMLTEDKPRGNDARSIVCPSFLPKLLYGFSTFSVLVSCVKLLGLDQVFDKSATRLIMESRTTTAKKVRRQRKSRAGCRNCKIRKVKVRRIFSVYGQGEGSTYKPKSSSS